MANFTAVTSERTDPSRLARLEQKIQSALPEAYRQFLLRHNGGKPERRIFTFNEHGSESTDAIRYFYADCSNSLYSIEEKLRIYSGRIPQGHLPIACDSLGNLVLLSVNPGDYGAIYFWDHERELPRPGSRDNLYIVASSFEEFIESLREKGGPRNEAC
jgi:hypothetical protein